MEESAKERQLEEHRKVIEAAKQTRAHVRAAIEEAQRVLGLPEGVKVEEDTAETQEWRHP